MKRLAFFSLLFMVLGIFLIEKIQTDAGYVLISFGTRTIETSIWFAIACVISVFLLVLVLVWLVLKLWTSITGSVSWLSSRRSLKVEQKFRDGLLHFFTGNWEQAKTLLSNRSKEGLPIVRALATAEALDRQGDRELALQYLHSTEQRFPEDARWIKSARIKKLLQADKLAEAEVLLSEIEASYPDMRMNTELRFVLTQKKRDWDTALSLLPELKKQKFYSVGELNELELGIEASRIKQLLEEENINVSKVDQAWSRVPKALKREIVIVEAYAELLFKVRNYSQLMELIDDLLPKYWSSRLVHLFGAIDSLDSQKQLEKAEKWLKSHSDDAVLLSVLGRLAKKNQFWGKSKNYYQLSLKIQESRDAYLGLAELADAMGEHKESVDWFKKAAYV